MQWLSDYVVGVLKSPTWANPVAEFVDLRCDIFDGGEYRHEHFECHKDQELHRVLVEQLLCVDDFQTFHAMMTKQNADLYKEAVTVDSKDDEHLLQASEAVDADGWQLYDQQLFSDRVALQGEDTETLRRSEEAEIAYAIALSLQLDGEKGAKDSAQETAVPAYTPISLQCKEAERAAPRPPFGAGFISSPYTHVLPPVQSSPGADTGSPVPTVGFVSAPLVPLLPIQTAPRCVRVEPLQNVPTNASQPEKPSETPQPTTRGPTPAEALAAAKAAAAAKTSAVAGGVSEDERQQRAEHLRKQRDLLLSKRQAERERQLAEHQQGSGSLRLAVDRARQVSQGNHAVVRHEAPMQGAAIRETLTRQLRQTLSNH
jgi:hypothetical protein